MVPTTEERQRIGERIRAAREARGWSQADFARRVGITQAGMSFYEAGDRFPVLGIAHAIARTLDMPVEELFVEVMPAGSR